MASLATTVLPAASEQAGRKPQKGNTMDLKQLSRALVIVGGVNWGLVALARFDLVAAITGNRFGGTNAATRLVYGLVGAAAVMQAADLVGEVQN